MAKLKLGLLPDFFHLKMAYELLHHNELELANLDKNYSKTLKQLKDADFKSEDVRKNGKYRILPCTAEY